MADAALAVAVVFLVCTANARALTIEEIVQRHLDWLAHTNNYVAELRLKGRGTPLGTVFVDNTKTPREVSFQGQVNVAGKSRQLAIQGTRHSSRAVLDQDRATEWTVGAGPFGGTFDLFSRNATVQETVDRLRSMSSELTVVDNPVGGRVGIRMRLDPGFLGRMDGLLDHVLLGGSIPRNIDSTLWFDHSGRLERMVLQDGQPDMVVTTVRYLQTNVSTARKLALAPRLTTSPAKTYPSLVEMMQGVVKEETPGKN